MDSLLVKVNTRSITASILLAFALTNSIQAWNTAYTIDGSQRSFVAPDIQTLDRIRYKREVGTAAVANPAAPAAPAAPVAPRAPAPDRPPVLQPSSSRSPPVDAANDGTENKNVTSPVGALNVTDDANRTRNKTEVTTAVATVTQTPLLGVNGSGILHVNLTGNLPKVSDPISPDDNFTDIFKETPELIKAEQNFQNLTYDNHNFYNSSFIGNLTYFNDYWANITRPPAEVHPVLSHSHRRAITLKLSFEFPFYGHYLRNITVATGGFIYTGEHVHNWLAATQYISPLMANFDTTLTNDSIIKHSDDGEKFTVLWENVTLQEDPSKKFTFAVSLYKSGDIVFAYKDIPIMVQDINDIEHPVKVGISDAYLNDRIIFFVRRKTIYEYHRVSFKTHNITSRTILKLSALPTCLQYTTCDTCADHDTAFNCSWCDHIQKCSSGTDRNKQDWMLRNCDRVPISNASMCPAPGGQRGIDPADTAYVTDLGGASDSASVVNTGPKARKSQVGELGPSIHAPVSRAANEPHSIGAIVVAFTIVTIVCSLGVWVFYAFRNPHTKSGQLLIKYRPSQWSWRRGEARYTAATIHM